MREPIPDFENDPNLTILQKKRRRHYYRYRERNIQYTAEWAKRNPDKVKEYHRKGRTVHREKRRYAAREYMRKKRANGTFDARKYYIENREKIAARMRIKIAQRKRDAIDAYGGKCACCGEAHIEFLSLDHINNDGKEHRKALSEKAGSGFYRVMKKLGYPKGQLQVLCLNCNGAKAYYGRCPHGES